MKTSFETFTEVEIASDVAGFLDKLVQDIFLLEVGEVPIANRFVNASEEMGSNPRLCWTYVQVGG